MKYFLLIILSALSMKSFGQTKPSNDSTSNLTVEVRSKILSESKDGGKLDFWTPIKGHEYDGLLLEKGSNIIVTKRELAVIKWALVLTKNGISKTEIVSLYEELKSRKIRADELQLIDMGIKKASE